MSGFEKSRNPKKSWKGRSNLKNQSMLNFTTETLVQYLYNELDPESARAIKAELQTNWALREKLQALEEVQKRLNAMPLPILRDSALDRIFATAHQLQIA